MKRRFTEITVLTDVRVMSDGGYWFTVRMKGGRTRSYQPGTGFEAVAKAWQFTWEGPKYLIREANRLIAEGCKNGTFRFYECDQDGNRRYENLRYHRPEHIAWWAEHLASE